MKKIVTTDMKRQRYAMTRQNVHDRFPLSPMPLGKTYIIRNTEFDPLCEIQADTAHEALRIAKERWPELDCRSAIIKH